MRHLSKAILLIVLASVAFAQGPIDRDLASLRKACYYQLATDTLGTKILTTGVANYAINRAIAQVCKQYPAIEKLDTVAVDKEDEGVVLNSDFIRVRQVYRMGGDTSRIPLAYIPIDSIAKYIGKAEGNIHKKKNELTSIRYYYTNGNRLFFHPKDAKPATDPDSFLVEYYAMDVMLAADTDSTAIGYEYIENLIWYACAILEATRRNYNGAAFDLSMFSGVVPGRVPREAELKR